MAQIEIKRLGPTLARIEVRLPFGQTQPPEIISRRGGLGPLMAAGGGFYYQDISLPVGGVYPVRVQVGTQSYAREIVAFDQYGASIGQPLGVMGDVVNTEGYEDSAVISPDGEYLYFMTGPWNFSGLLNANIICPSTKLAIRYDLNDCPDSPEARMLREIRGPSGPPLRPDFPPGAFKDGQLQLAKEIIVPGVANGIIAVPALIYGVKRQPDGSFAEPFKVAFNDERALNSPFGMSIALNRDGSHTFLLAWNNHFNGFGDEKPDIYYGALRPGHSYNLGNVIYRKNAALDQLGIEPMIKPMPFPSHEGTQGNPHLFVGHGALPTSIWTDDEDKKQDVALRVLIKGSFPEGDWKEITLPAVLNTAEHERQPFFDGQDLYMMRGMGIIRHRFGCLQADFIASVQRADCWGPEEILLGVKTDYSPWGVVAAGEPSIAIRDGRKYLYFVYGQTFEQQRFQRVVEVNMNIGWVPID